MTDPIISIIVPSFNQGKYIEQTLKSIIDQDYSLKEIIVIDGGSTDDSVAIIKAYSHEIKYWVSEKDNGQTHAINKGLKIAKGQIITWLNSDDYFLPDTLRKVASIWKETQFDLLVGQCVFVDGNGSIISYEPKSKLVNGNVYLPFSSDCIINQPSSFFSANAVKLTGPLDESLFYSMDVDFWMKLSVRGGIFLECAHVFTAFRRHEEAKSSIGNIAFLEDTLKSVFFQIQLKRESIKQYKLFYRLFFERLWTEYSLSHLTNKLFLSVFRNFIFSPLFAFRILFSYSKKKIKLFFKSRIA